MCLQACEFQLYEPLVKSRTRHVEKTSRRRLRDSPNVTSPGVTSTQSDRRNGSMRPRGAPRYLEILWCSRIISEISAVHSALPAPAR